MLIKITEEQQKELLAIFKHLNVQGTDAARKIIALEEAVNNPIKEKK